MNQFIIGKVVEMGNDEEGQPFILIHSTEAAIKDGPAMLYKSVRIERDPGK